MLNSSRYRHTRYGIVCDTDWSLHRRTVSKVFPLFPLSLSLSLSLSLIDEISISRQVSLSGDAFPPTIIHVHTV